MTRERILMVLGALVLLSPWSGLPLAWLEWVLLVLGLLIIATAYLMRKRQNLLPPPSEPMPQVEEPRPRSSNIAFS